MPSEVDDISLMMGEVRAGIAEGERQRAAIFRKLDEIVAHINQVSGAMTLLGEQHLQLRAKVATMEPYVENYKALRNQGIGVIAVIGLMGSVFGAAIVKYGPDWLRGGAIIALLLAAAPA